MNVARHLASPAERRHGAPAGDGSVPGRTVGTMISKVWVADGWLRTSVRADQILAVRIRYAPSQSAATTWQVELTTAAPVAGDDGDCIVVVSRGDSEGWAYEQAGELIELIARHIDDPGGGRIDAHHQVDEDERTDLLGNLIGFTPFDVDEEL